MNVDSGQFLKAEPGVAKVLGIMNLQALPKRLALDFRDVFSEGFGFDQITAKSKIARGVLNTDDFKMKGTTAAALMAGDIDLGRETQNLRVVVIPDFSGGMGSIVTAAMGNPLLGLATYLAQMALKDPLGKAFSIEYTVTGSWGDPKMVRLERQVARNDSIGEGGPSPHVPAPTPVPNPAPTPAPTSPPAPASPGPQGGTNPPPNTSQLSPSRP
jgi:uncharacterized protein YhdP